MLSPGSDWLEYVRSLCIVENDRALRKRCINNWTALWKFMTPERRNKPDAAEAMAGGLSAVGHAALSVVAGAYRGACYPGVDGASRAGNSATGEVGCDCLT